MNEDLKAELARLADENERLRAMPPWRPIATAPQNGTRVLIYIDGAVRVGWLDAKNDWRSDTAYLFPRPPTHWMLLPEPPK